MEQMGEEGVAERKVNEEKKKLKGGPHKMIQQIGPSQSTTSAKTISKIT